MDHLFLLLLIPVSRFLININDWYFFKALIKKQWVYHHGFSAEASEEDKKASSDASNWVVANMTEIKRRVAKAGIHNPVKSYMEPKGYGFVGQQQLAVLDNMLYMNSEIQGQARRTVDTAKGYYLNQALNSLSPLYWLEVIFFLPKQIAAASGLALSSKGAETVLNILQIIYWLVIGWALIFKPELVKQILDLKP